MYNTKVNVLTSYLVRKKFPLLLLWLLPFWDEHLEAEEC